MSADTQGDDTLVANERSPARDDASATTASKIVPVVQHHIAMLDRM
jgi:hypothetical protein